MFPGDAPGESAVSWEQAETATGYFEQVTLAKGVSETLARSLAYIERLGVENIQRHAQGLIGKLRRELPKLGYPVITPEEARGPIVAFSLKDPTVVAEKLKKAILDVTIADHRMRVSPSVYNDGRDVEKLVAALGARFRRGV